MSLHYQIIGDSDTSLLLIHGLFGSGDNWRGIAKQLSPSYQVISVDLRNHGRSFQHAQQSYDLMAVDIAEVLDKLNIDKTHLLGHSIGGKVAMQFAAQYAERLDKLVVVDIAPRQYADGHSQIFKTLMSVDLSQYQQRSDIDNYLKTFIPDSGVRSFLLMNVVSVSGELSWRINLEYLFCNYPALLQPVSLDTKVDNPTLFIRGADSDYINADDRQQIRNQFTNVQIVAISKAGHWVHADQPAYFTEMVTRFLK
ncbi:alpha/beta fold hydrolase [Methylophaga sp. OBS3]|uniref:alpha/beta fold hydrolase n=1 Tax=Methylophaga sp. OBS3 TaxID=2991934 RepID=UPI00225327CD|nr:alpha/beta fold hydrolase [Methylophaga sp. OBS3]MCX4190210.1 alpha/beta fold hydrolase [Methylophaga sp. OBS3]